MLTLKAGINGQEPSWHWWLTASKRMNPSPISFPQISCGFFVIGSAKLLLGVHVSSCILQAQKELVTTSSTKTLHSCYRSTEPWPSVAWINAHQACGTVLWEESWKAGKYTWALCSPPKKQRAHLTERPTLIRCNGACTVLSTSPIDDQQFLLWDNLVNVVPDARCWHFSSKSLKAKEMMSSTDFIQSSGHSAVNDHITIGASAKSVRQPSLLSASSEWQSVKKCAFMWPELSGLLKQSAKGIHWSGRVKASAGVKKTMSKARILKCIEMRWIALKVRSHRCHPPERPQTRHTFVTCALYKCSIIFYYFHAISIK